MKKIFILCWLAAASLVLTAQETPPSADRVLKEACDLAGRENKKVMIIFHASWCGWCHKMDTSMNDPVCKKFFDDNYVVQHLVVSESKDKKNLENPGAEEMKNRYNGADQGIPYWLIFDKDQNMLFDSRIRKEGQGAAEGDNSGCPATEKEVDYFIKVLKKTTRLKEDQLKVIEKRFRRNE